MPSIRIIVCTLALICTGHLKIPEAAAQARTNPHGALPDALTCTACHAETSWTRLRQPPAFDHDGSTAFALEGPHREAACASCHLDLRFTGTDGADGDCATCHFDVHQARLGSECADCHRVTSFLDVSPVDIHARTFFPLTGAHLAVACEGCHADERRGAFAGQDAECVGCHLGAYRSATDPDHEALQLSRSCEQCHGTVTWIGALPPGGLATSRGAPAPRRPCLQCHRVDGP